MLDMVVMGSPKKTHGMQLLQPVMLNKSKYQKRLKTSHATHRRRRSQTSIEPARVAISPKRRGMKIMTRPSPQAMQHEILIQQASVDMRKDPNTLAKAQK